MATTDQAPTHDQAERHEIIWSSGSSDAPACDPTGGCCITCGDVGIPMTVLELDAGDGLARCQDANGVTSEVDLSLVAGATAGDAVIVHAGVAIAFAAEQG